MMLLPRETRLEAPFSIPKLSLTVLSETSI